jgi:hypothetical protein
MRSINCVPGAVLGFGHQMGVGMQGEARVVVAQVFGYRPRGTNVRCLLLAERGMSATEGVVDRPAHLEHRLVAQDPDTTCER